MKNAYKKLGKNLSLFTISSFGTKIISFILVPIYTNCLSTAEYGTADLLSTVVQLLIPIFTLDIADAVIRFTLDDNSDKESVFFISIKIVLMGAGLLAAILFAGAKFFQVNYPTSYIYFIFAGFLFISIYNSITNYFRGLNRIIDIVISGIMSTIVSGVCNIIFLLKFDMGLNGYFAANLLGVLIPVLFLSVRALQSGIIKFPQNRVYCSNLQRQMLVYCAPLIINGLSWWINNSLDRIFVTSMCGVDENGLLAVAYKIPSIMSMFQTIFNQAWTISAVQEFDSQDKNGFLSKAYSLYGCGMTIVCSFVLLLNIPFAKILYAKDFFQAWQYTGMLVVAQLFGALSICISGVFNAVKDSKVLAFSTFIGAVVNTILNYILIKQFGVQGAVIATMISNVIIWVYRMHKVLGYVKLKINFKRDIISYIIILVQTILGMFSSQLYIVQSLCIISILVLYREEVDSIYRVFLKEIRRIMRRK